MARQTKSIVKTYFETGDTPTESQFGDLIDSTYNVATDEQVTELISGESTSLHAHEISGVTGLQDALDEKIGVDSLNANIVIYPTTANSDIETYFKLVDDIADPDYDSVAADVPTGTITGSNQLIASLASSQGLIKGDIGIVNVTIIGNIRRTAGTGTSSFYFEIYKRTDEGVETLLSTSANTLPVSSPIYVQFFDSALINDGPFLLTDRIVLKFYGTRITGGSDPSFDFQFGGVAPVRTLIPIPLVAVPSDAHNDLTGLQGGTEDEYYHLTLAEKTVVENISGVNTGDETTASIQAKRPLKTINSESLEGSGDIAISGGSSGNIPMAMLSEGNNDFVIMASVIASAGGTLTHGQPIVWEILKPNTDHEYSFYRGIKGLPSTALEIRYPKVKNVISSIMTGDEELRKFGVHFGSTTGIQTTTFIASRLIPQGFQLRGNSTNWTASGIFNAAYSLNTISSGLTTLNLQSTTTGFDPTIPIITYTGRNNYRIERVYSGLGGTAGFGFYLVNIDTNSRITTAPTVDDYVHISNWGIGQLQVNLLNYIISLPSTGNGFLFNNNFWTIGMFELWMKSFPISSTEMKIIWQPKSGVTTYKLRRSTAYTADVNGDYVLTTPTEIYTGTALEFIDTGLTANTMYYYQLLDQTDTEITQFNSKTK